MKFPKWLKKNWLRVIFWIALAGLIIFLLSYVRSCDEAAYKEDIKELDKEISELKEKNVKLEDEAVEFVEGAEAYEKVVAEKEANIERSRLIILDLRKKREEVVAEVMELPPSQLVERTREILDCAAVELTDDGILFSEDCARRSLAMIAQFSLIKEEIEQTGFSLSEYGEALQFQKMVSWKLYGALWKLGGQVLNYKVMVKKLDLKFEKSEKQRKKGWLRGLGTGLMIGAGITVTFMIVIPAIKKIF
jgi:Fe2+ transport system protein B